MNFGMHVTFIVLVACLQGKIKNKLHFVIGHPVYIFSYVLAILYMFY